MENASEEWALACEPGQVLVDSVFDVFEHLRQLETPPEVTVCTEGGFKWRGRLEKATGRCVFISLPDNETVAIGQGRISAVQFDSSLLSDDSKDRVPSESSRPKCDVFVSG